MSKGKILFQLSGSIACFKSAALISKLVQHGYEIEVIATQGALQFIGPATLEGLTGRPILTNVFESGKMMSHIHLMRWADLIILCPATANLIGKMASGIADDFISTLFLAHDFAKPYLIAPAMNTRMFQHPATRVAFKTLREWGVKILDTDNGQLACGETGDGRLLDPEILFNEIQTSLQKKPVAKPSPQRRLNILFTSGGTREPIDGVRSITNFSSGKTGATMAEHFVHQGHSVMFLHAADSQQPFAVDSNHPDVLTTRSYITFKDLQSLMYEELSQHSYDVIIHLAAVSDYSIESIEDGENSNPIQIGQGKIDSQSSLKIVLKKNPKLVDQVKRHSRNPNIVVVAFKLTNTLSDNEQIDAVERLMHHAQPDYIVQNDLHNIDNKNDIHLAKIYEQSRGQKEIHFLSAANSKTELAQQLELAFLSNLNSFQTIERTLS